MNSTDKKKGDIWDKSLNYSATLLGIISTVLTIVITITTLSINGRINKLNENDLRLDIQIKTIDEALKKNEQRLSEFDNSVRLEYELQVFPANAFANIVNIADKNKMKVRFLLDTQRDFKEWISDWQERQNLMTSSPKDGLLVRQVLCLKIINAGKIPAKKMRLRFSKAKFDNVKGEYKESYTEMDTSNWTKDSFPIGELSEAPKSELLKTQMIIPLAHLSGQRTYFGQVFVPLELTWTDEIHGKTETKSINVRDDDSLGLVLEGLDIGFSSACREICP
jgi:hypothetical protein